MRNLKRIPLLVLLLVTLLLNLAFVSQAVTITGMVDVASFTKNMSGSGYEWNNRTRTLTLNNLHISTEQRFGMKIPDGVTVILQGDNVIEASYAALATEGEVTFEGEGSLTLKGGDYGLYGYGTAKERVNRFLGIKCSFYGTVAAVKFDIAKVMFESHSDVSLSSSASGLGIDGVVVKLLDSKLVSSAPLSASQQLILQNSDVLVVAAQSALLSPRTLAIDYATLQVGDSENALTATETYQGEKVLKLTPTGREGRTSLIFGDSCPAFVDYILLVIVLAGVSCLIIIPVARQKKKDRLARESFEKNYQ